MARIWMWESLILRCTSFTWIALPSHPKCPLVPRLGVAFRDTVYDVYREKSEANKFHGRVDWKEVVRVQRLASFLVPKD